MGAFFSIVCYLVMWLPVGWGYDAPDRLAKSILLFMIAAQAFRAMFTAVQVRARPTAPHGELVGEWVEGGRRRLRGCEREVPGMRKGGGLLRPDPNRCFAMGSKSCWEREVPGMRKGGLLRPDPNRCFAMGSKSCWEREVPGMRKGGLLRPDPNRCFAMGSKSCWEAFWGDGQPAAATQGSQGPSGEPDCRFP
jgi:hypothetical protein